MSRAQTRARERARRDDPEGGPASEAFASTIGQSDADIPLRSVQEGEPAGFGSESNTASQAFELLDETEIPAGRQGELVEASLAIAGNGEAFVALRGIEYGPYTGAVEASIPFGNAALVEGDSVRVLHRSTDGEPTTTRAQVTLRLF